MDSVRSGSYGQLFRPDNFVFGKLTRCSQFEFFFCYLDVMSFIYVIDKSDFILLSSCSRTKV